MRFHHLFLAGALLGAGQPGLHAQEDRALETGTNQPLGSSLTWVKDRQLFVRRRDRFGRLARAELFKMRGVSYSPVATCQDVLDRRELREHLRNSPYRDYFRLIQEMNANCIKTYVDLGTDKTATRILDEAYRRGLWVWITLIPDAAHEQGEASNAEIVAAYKDHPALLGWIIGNEWNLNLHWHYASIGAAQIDTQATVQLVKNLDGRHPVASSLGFNPDHYNLGPAIETSEFPNILSGVPGADLWAINLYRSRNFGSWWLEWEMLAPDKPFFFGEFGTDSWRTTNLATGDGLLDVTLQAGVAVNLFDEIHRNLSAIDPSRACIGGSIFSWTDGWWKDSKGSLCEQDVGGFAALKEKTDFRGGGLATTFLGHPDGYSNEENFGLLDVSGNPKQAYNWLSVAYSLTWTQTNPVILQARSQGGGPDAYYWMSMDGEPFVMRYSAFSEPAGGRGFNVAVIDAATGVVSSIKNYDTFADPSGATAGMVADLAAVALGDYVMIAVADTALPFVNTCTPLGSVPVLQPIAEALRGLGSSLESSIQYRQPYVLVGRAGIPGAALVEALGQGSCITGIFADVQVSTVIRLDFDRDGIPDDVDLDADNDGVSNLIELQQGTDILDPAEH